MHTNYSEGRKSLETMIEKVDSLGYEYVAITDHPRSQKIANGMGIEKLQAQWKEIGKLPKRFKIKILRGSEIEILKDGSLDYPDEILKELDIVVGAVHSGFSAPKKKMTERIITALEKGTLTSLLILLAGSLGKGKLMKWISKKFLIQRSQMEK
jgi:DNA polymerase (family 10)